MVWVLLGAPGCGKGTQANMLMAQSDMKSYSTGEMLRKAVAEGSELGSQVKSYMESGGLVPDELIANVLAARLEQDGIGSGVLLDGFPRTLPQAQLLDNMLKKNGWTLSGVLYFDTEEAVILQRLGGRLSCPGCGAGYHATSMPPVKAGICDKCGAELITRKDDTPEAIQNRLRVYAESTEPLVAYYQQQGALKNIDASGNADEVFAKVKAVIGL
ncbi:MAG: adenylate kinase [Armatimonadota bacterium]